MTDGRGSYIMIRRYIDIYLGEIIKYTRMLNTMQKYTFWLLGQLDTDPIDLLKAGSVDHGKGAPPNLSMTVELTSATPAQRTKWDSTARQHETCLIAVTWSSISCSVSESTMTEFDGYIA
jgi:hypothetical protein